MSAARITGQIADARATRLTADRDLYKYRLGGTGCGQGARQYVFARCSPYRPRILATCPSDSTTSSSTLTTAGRAGPLEDVRFAVPLSTRCLRKRRDCSYPPGT